MQLKVKLLYKLAPPLDVEAPPACTFGQLKVRLSADKNRLMLKPPKWSRALSQCACAQDLAAQHFKVPASSLTMLCALQPFCVRGD